MGFYLGGQPILELARMKNPNVRVMVTFHGVFNGILGLASGVSNADVTRCHVLVCTGEDDPFVPPDDLDTAMDMFRDLGYQSKLMKFERTRHGFMNPAHDYNPSDTFAYNGDVHPQAWTGQLRSRY